MPNQVADVIVVGAGNAAFCAALAAQEAGASVVMCEAAPEEESGGNSRFTAGSIRVVYNGVDDIKTLVPDLTPAEIETTDFGTYTADQFYDDMARITQNRADPDLVELLVAKSFNSLNWMRNKGVRLIPIYGRQAFKIEGKFKFWGGLTVESVGGGPGLIDMLTASAKKRGIDVRYATRGLDLLFNGNRIEGVRVREHGDVRELRRNPWCWPAAASRQTPKCACAITVPAGRWPRCAARGTTPATASRRWRSAPRRRRLVIVPRGAVGAERPRSAIAWCWTITRSTPTRSASWSTPTASASSTRAPTTAITPTPNTAAWCWNSPVNSPGRSSTRRPNTCNATNTAFGKSPK